MLTIGVLALQGNFAAHVKKITALNTNAVLVKKPADLANIDGLIIPGGESTTLLKLLHFIKLDIAINEFYKTGKAIYGTCAGMILLAKNVLPAQKSFAFIDITVKRNAYGRQIDSFIANIDGCNELKDKNIEAIFIRAPEIVSVDSENVLTLATYKKKPVLVRQKNILAGAFHPELTNNNIIHEYFFAICKDKFLC